MSVAFVCIWWHAKKFFICMKKIENDSLIEKIKNLMKKMNWEIENLIKMMNREIENLIKMKSARSFLSINHFCTIIIQCHFCMNLMTCKIFFSSVWKNSKTIFRMMIWMIDFHQVLDFWFIIFIKLSISQFIIFIKFSTSLIERSFSNFFIQMKNFFACHQMYAKATLINDRRYYKKWCDDRGWELDKNQSFKSSLEKSFSNFFIQMKKFSCMSSNSYENDTEWWLYKSDLSKEKSAQTLFWSGSRSLDSLFWSSFRFLNSSFSSSFWSSWSKNRFRFFSYR